MDTAVSVIVPVYNGESTIKNCIDSILAQSLSDIEIIAINDGSCDNTLSVLEGIHDKRLRVISQENQGQGFARNKGIAAACGEYIAFVDADDTIERDMLRIMYETAKESKADVTECNIWDIYPDGTRKIQLDINDETVEISDRGEYLDKYFTTCRHSYEVCNKLIRRKVLEKATLRFCDTKKYFSEDLLFNLELISYIGKISFIKEAYYNYYQNENSHFHTDNKKRLLSICALFEKYMCEADSEMKSAASYTAAMVILYNAGFCVKSDRKTVKEILYGKEFQCYVNAALRRKCTVKHRILLLLIKFLPAKLMIAQKYSWRYKNENTD